MNILNVYVKPEPLVKTSPPAREEGGESTLAEAKAPWVRRHGGDLLAALALAAFTLVIFWKALADPARGIRPRPLKSGVTISGLSLWVKAGVWPFA